MILPNSLLWPRMGSVRVLVIAVLISTLIVATTVAALTGFATGALPGAVSSELARSPRTTISIYGGFSAQQARIDRPRVSAALRAAFGPIPFTASEAIWSDPFAVAGRTGGKAVALVQAASFGAVRSQVRLTAGTWPAAAAAGRPVQVVAPASIAADLHMKTGQPVELRDRQSGARVRFVLTGQYRPADPSARYWGLSLLGTSGSSVQNGFITYGPLLAAPQAFSAGRLATDGATWLAAPAIRRVAASQLRPLAKRVRTVLAGLASSPELGGLQVSSGLPDALSGVATKLVVATSLLLVGQIELLLLAAAALVLAARTLASQREDESALLSARGAGRWQMLRLTVAETLLVAAIGTGAGVLIGTRLAAALAGSGQLGTAGLRVSGVPAGVWWTTSAVLALCVAVMAWPAVRPMTPAAARAGKGRRATVSAAARAGGDVALVLLAVLAVWQLRQYSVLGRASGGLDVDPVLAGAPAIALAAATVLPLRVLPALAAAGDRLAARTRRFGVAMTSWQLSRRATGQSAPMLLVVLAVGTGTLALAQHQSWRRSAFDQAAFVTGADVRADVMTPLPLGRTGAIARAPGVTSAMAVSTSLLTPSGVQVLAVDAARARETALLRPDESPVAPARLWRLLAPPAASRAVQVPGRPARLKITASLAGGRGPGIGPFAVTVRVADGTGAVYSLPAGLLPADGRPRGLIVNLSPARQAVYPLRLLRIAARFTLPPVPHHDGREAAAARTAALTVRAFATSSSAAGAFSPPFASGRALAGWTPAIASQDLAVSGVGVLPSLTGQTVPGRVGFHPGFGQTSQSAPRLVPPLYPRSGQLTLVAPAPRTIPAIATRAFLSASDLRDGGLFQVVAPGPATITVKIVASVTAFPTIAGQGGGLIVGLGAVQDVLAAQGAPPLPVSQWWLATRSGAVPVGLPPGTAVADRSRLAAGLLNDPMSVIPQQAVQWIAVAAALLAVLGFSVSIAGSVHERRPQAALLSALGVARPAQVRLLCLEAFALSAPAAVTGLLLGVLLAHLLVPAMILTPAATVPVPPALVSVPVPAVLALCLAVLAIPVVAAAGTALRRPDTAGQLRAGEAG